MTDQNHSEDNSAITGEPYFPEIELVCPKLQQEEELARQQQKLRRERRILYHTKMNRHDELSYVVSSMRAYEAVLNKNFDALEKWFIPDLGILDDHLHLHSRNRNFQGTFCTSCVVGKGLYWSCEGSGRKDFVSVHRFDFWPSSRFRSRVTPINRDKLSTRLVRAEHIPMSI